VLILVSAMTKKIIRGPKSPFRPEDFYLGVDLTLAAFSAAAVNVIDVGAKGGENLAWFFAFTFIIFILQLAFHQEWAGLPETSIKPMILLGFFANGIGVTLLGVFIHWKIQGKL
jgi:hypothetical protein